MPRYQMRYYSLSYLKDVVCALVLFVWVSFHSSPPPPVSEIFVLRHVHLFSTVESFRYSPLCVLIRKATSPHLT